MRKPLFITFLVSVILCIMPLVGSAQGDFNINRVQQILSITTVPKIPEANERVSISIDSSAYELSSATISWYVNSKLIKSGKGQKDFSFTTGALGTETHVGIIISPLSGAIFRKDLYFTPAEIALLWEAQTYTPPFYKGKALFTNQALYRVVATPEFITKDGRRLDPSTLVYDWKKDDKARGSLSGYGERSFNYFGSVLGLPEKISVIASSQDGKLKAKGEIIITPVSPLVTLYENNPLYGILYNHALGETFRLNEKEISFTAVPFFFSRKNSNNDELNFNWSVNGDAVGDKREDIITLRNDNESGGRSILNVAITNSSNTFQNATKNLSILFNTQ